MDLEVTTAATLIKTKTIKTNLDFCIFMVINLGIFSCLIKERDAHKRGHFYVIQQPKRENKVKNEIS